MPTVEVRYENLKVVAEVQTGSRALPTLANSVRDAIEVEYHSVLDFNTSIYSFGLVFGLK